MDPTIIVTIVVALIGAGATLGAAVISYRAGGRRASQEPSSASGPPPRPISTNPPDRAIDVPPDILPTVAFAKDMDPATISPNTFKLLDVGTLNPVETTVTNGVVYDESARMATFYPADPLQNGTTYAATITARVRDKEGNRLEEDQTWYFTVRGYGE